MLTGFNTDIRHSKRVYHVQTEDRGPGNPVIESLVYVGGEILLSKKKSYTEHVHGDKVDEKAVREMMDVQHRRIIEAIRRGRLESKKGGEAPADIGDETSPSPPRVSPAAVAALAAILSAPAEPLPGDDPDRTAAKERPGSRSGLRPIGTRPDGRPISGVPPRAIPMPAHTPQPLPKPIGTSGVRPAVPSKEGSEIFMETFVSSGPPPAAPPAPRPASLISRAVPAVPPAPALSPPTQAPLTAGGSKTLDQVIVDYLASEAASERLELSIMAGADFVSGGTVPLTVIATTSLSRKPVPGAQVTVRVVSTSGPPQVLYRGLTGNDGMVKTSCALPEIGGGNAAVIIVGFSPLGSGEAKYLIRKKGT